LEKTKINLTELLQESERNRIRAEMERDKVTTIINSFSDGIVILDEKGEIFSINPESEKILELQAIRLLKKPLQALADFPRAKPIISLLDAGFRGVFREEVSLTKDLIIELSVKPFNLYENGIGHLIVLHDVSREKRVEKMKSEFVSLAAHQLRTPLSIIKWSMSMLKKGDYGKLSGKQVDVIKTTFQNNERLISLVNDLLNITHIEEGRYLYQVAMSDMKEIIKTVINIYNEEINKNKIKIEFTAPDNLPQTMVDSEKIKLVVQNLIDNAIKYSHKGGKMIITLKKDEENIEFKVEDFGIGIPDSNKEKMFTKFSRGDNAIKVNTIGSGLGLFLVKNIVEAHGGKIWFESKENTGTSFYFSLPIKKN
jgi:PAS domain S-box-containing protein